MSKYIPGNQKHLTLENRIYIENELNKGTSFKDIARFLCKDPTTIWGKGQTIAGWVTPLSLTLDTIAALLHHPEPGTGGF